MVMEKFDSEFGYEEIIEVIDRIINLKTEGFNAFEIAERCSDEIFAMFRNFTSIEIDREAQEIAHAVYIRSQSENFKDLKTAINHALTHTDEGILSEIDELAQKIVKNTENIIMKKLMRNEEFRTSIMRNLYEETKRSLLNEDEGSKNKITESVKSELIDNLKKDPEIIKKLSSNFINEMTQTLQ